MSGLKDLRSGVVVAKMLRCEGFTSPIANAVRRWWRRRVASQHHRRNYDRAKRSLGEMVRRLELSDGDRLILGRFIACHGAAFFQSGVNIGLTAATFPAQENGELPKQSNLTKKMAKHRKVLRDVVAAQGMAIRPEQIGYTVDEIKEAMGEQ